MEKVRKNIHIYIYICICICICIFPEVNFCLRYVGSSYYDILIGSEPHEYKDDTDESRGYG